MVGPKVILCYKTETDNEEVFKCLNEEAERKRYWEGEYPMDCYRNVTTPGTWLFNKPFNRILYQITSFLPEAKPTGIWAIVCLSVCWI